MTDTLLVVVVVQAVALCALCLVVVGLACAVVPLWWRVWRAEALGEANRAAILKQAEEVAALDTATAALLEWREGFNRHNARGS